MRLLIFRGVSRTPGFNIIWDGATLDSPERVVIPDPPTGEWLAIVDGYTILSKDDRYELTTDIE